LVDKPLPVVRRVARVGGPRSATEVIGIFVLICNIYAIAYILLLRGVAVGVIYPIPYIYVCRIGNC
jgi:hypothetical protein